GRRACAPARSAGCAARRRAGARGVRAPPASSAGTRRAKAAAVAGHRRRASPCRRDNTRPPPAPQALDCLSRLRAREAEEERLRWRTGAFLALGLGLASLGGPPGALARRSDRVVTTVVLNGQCPDPCPVRELRKGGFEMRVTGARGANGLLFRLKL